MIKQINRTYMRIPFKKLPMGFHMIPYHVQYESRDFVSKNLDQPTALKEINRENIMTIVKKYRHYIKQWDKLNDLFAKYDVNNNGILEKSEIRQLMIDKAGGVVKFIEYLQTLSTPKKTLITSYEKLVKLDKKSVSKAIDIIYTSQNPYIHFLIKNFVKLATN